MDTEDTLSSPLLPSKNEKEAQKVPDHPHKDGTLKATHKWTGFQGKTLWDWLQLLGVLAIPLVVVGATLLFGIQQANLAQQQHETDKQSALDQQEATILQTYIDNIQDLLLNHNLLKSQSTDEVAILARARTLTALQGLDPHRKGVLLNFLYEANLIGYFGPENILNSIIYLRDANLRNADLSYANLSYANLSYANLSYANLAGAYPYGADLSGADLSNANLSNANLSSAILRNTNLRNANLRNADLSNADLSNADLAGANLAGANLITTHLDESTVTQQQLDQVYSCKGATLPQRLTCFHTPPSTPTPPPPPPSTSTPTPTPTP
jgi:uncharacterized protein YjbI with pentapeptide repeats